MTPYKLTYLFLFILAFFTCTTAAIAIESLDAPIFIHFRRGSVEIDDGGMSNLKELAELLKKTKIKTVLIEGFSSTTPDSSANSEVNNYDLSLSRAQAVAQLLRQLSGLPEELFQVKPIGSAYPLASNDTPEGQSKNRRVEVRIFQEGKQSTAPERHVERPTERQPVTAREKPQETTSRRTVTITLRDASVAEAFEMLSMKERVNIILDKQVQGNVSLNLYNISLNEAIESIAEAVGCSAEQRKNGYVIAPKKPETTSPKTGMTLRTFRLQYAEPAMVKDVLSKYVTEKGTVTVLEKQGILLIEDFPESLTKLETILNELDRQPRQVLIEAKILEIALTDGEKFGLDWAKLFSASTPDGTIGRIGAQGLSANTSAAGLLINLSNINITTTLTALSEKGRVHTLSTPKLMALEKQEASVIIGDRQGYKVTTTINLVTNENIQFLESGVILKVTPSIDKQNRILMRIHPEVSTGAIQAGIPSQNTTTVDTNLLAENDQTIFIGGLIKNNSTTKESGVPVLSAIPVVGNLFSNLDEKITSTETVVLITPHIVDDTETSAIMLKETNNFMEKEEGLKDRKVWTDQMLGEDENE